VNESADGGEPDQRHDDKSADWMPTSQEQRRQQQQQTQADVDGLN
jgi:hypothetical protein